MMLAYLLPFLENEVVNYGNNNLHFESVLKKLLPNAGGTNFTGNWSVGASQTISQQWSPDNFIDEDHISDQLNVVVFVQDESNKNILQTSSYYVLENVTEVQNISASKTNGLILFPNPANDYTYIVLKQALTYKANMYMYNQTGNLILTQTITEGSSISELNTDHLLDGLYFIKIIGENKLIGTSKLIIAR